MRELICAALPCDLERPISRDKRLHNEIAGMTHGMMQYDAPEDLGHSIV